MKCGVSMGVTAGQSSTRLTGGIVHCQNKLRFPWITCAWGAAGVHQRLVSWRVISCQTGRTKWGEREVHGNTQLAVFKAGKCRCGTRAAVCAARAPNQSRWQTKMCDCGLRNALTAMSADSLQRHGLTSSCLTSSSDFFSENQPSKRD